MSKWRIARCVQLIDKRPRKIKGNKKINHPSCKTDLKM